MDGVVSTRAEAPWGPQCPTGRRPVSWADNAVRTLCSVNCKLVDLGGWLDQRFALPESPPDAPVPTEFEVGVRRRVIGPGLR